MKLKKRDVSVDIFRSLAIVLMVSANMAVIADGQPLWIFRLSSSLAAPMFIVLANMMVVLGYLKGKTVPSTLIKTLFLFIVAILLDLSNSVLPLVNVDVLYFIGISLFVTHIVVRYSITTISIIALIILVLTPYLEYKYGYRTNMLYYLNNENIRQSFFHFADEIPKRYFIDGWFPLFPWLSIGLLGAVLGKLRYRGHGGTAVSFAERWHVLAGCCLLLIGIIVWWQYPGDQIIIEHYIELFYPPTVGFVLVAMGITFLAICFFDYIGDVSIWAYLHPLGEASLFMYLFHIVVIGHVLMPMGKISFGLRYFIFFLILINMMIGLGYLLRHVRKQNFYKNMPHFVKWIFG